jgi:hypothetical protein
LGSARASRAGDPECFRGRELLVHCLCGRRDGSWPLVIDPKDCLGEAPKPAREGACAPQNQLFFDLSSERKSLDRGTCILPVVFPKQRTLNRELDLHRQDACATLRFDQQTMPAVLFSFIIFDRLLTRHSTVVSAQRRLVAELRFPSQNLAASRLCVRLVDVFVSDRLYERKGR